MVYTLPRPPVSLIECISNGRPRFFILGPYDTQIDLVSLKYAYLLLFVHKASLEFRGTIRSQTDKWLFKATPYQDVFVQANGHSVQTSLN